MEEQWEYLGIGELAIVGKPHMRVKECGENRAGREARACGSGLRKPTLWVGSGEPESITEERRSPGRTTLQEMSSRRDAEAMQKVAVLVLARQWG